MLKSLNSVDTNDEPPLNSLSYIEKKTERIYLKKKQGVASVTEFHFFTFSDVYHVTDKSHIYYR
jgi:hypothetical protein